MRRLHDAAGRLTQLVNFNGTVTKYFYDNADRLTGIDSRTAANAVVASFAYTLDANGNRVEVEKQSPLQPLLPAISESSQHQQDRLSTRRNIQYTYDHEGQLATSKEGSAAAQVFSFNKAYRLTGISGGTTYSYDGSGNRLRAVRNGVETRYIYDAAGNLLAETDTAGAVSRYYIHGLGLLAAVTPADAVSCYHYDGVGSTVAITNSSQTVVNAYAYDPFGNILSQNEAFAQPFKYVGKLGVMAEPNGFYSMRARYYDPAAGRFISEDPLGFDGGDVNLYVYAGNNPVNRVDPEGLRTWSLGISGSAGLGVGGGGGIFLNVGHDSSQGLLEGWSASMTVTAGAGAYGGIGAGTQVQVTTTDACNVSQLNGAGMAFGSSAGAGIQGGAEYVTNIGGTVEGASYYLGYGTRSTFASLVSTYAFGTTTSPIFSVSQGK